MESLNAESKTWVFKMPNYIAEAWRNVEGQELGRLTVVEAPGKKPKVSLRLTGTYAESLPKNYEMQMEEDTDLHVFRAKAGTASSEGKVDCKMDARVVAMTVGADGKSKMDGHFLRITKQKSDEEKQKRKANTIQYLEPQQGGRIIRPLPKTANFKRKAEREQSVKLKRSRMERDDLEKELFSLFEQEKYWRFAELQGKLNQPGPWLKEVVNEIAVLNRNGPNLGKYELKAEYQVDQ
ncbi:hypothetical protein BSKO_00925 [Bryopsis sp. KO-2023]|nr:hypothetical protein BSKO_00925 [Bryopsis sp. KO-2023]